MLPPPQKRIGEELGLDELAGANTPSLSLFFNYVQSLTAFLRYGKGCDVMHIPFRKRKLIEQYYESRMQGGLQPSEN